MITWQVLKMINLFFPVEPMGAVRMTKRGKYVSDSAKRYLAYKAHLQWLTKQQINGEFYSAGALQVNILFIMPIPESWSMKKKREAVGQYHVKKPDADNLVKGVFDSLNKFAWTDDNQVAKVIAEKVYGEYPGINVVIKQLKAKEGGEEECYKEPASI
ncbi:RusA family crossover junction endodeoxyribonuclease [Bacillus sp. Hm123]|uniref:RusA family crossover junction endodeoxyribonuclease n=1 Tax=Bacillus sp. Hm123 TaxID=3450745 RepID=UPI003F433B5F